MYLVPGDKSSFIPQLLICNGPSDILWEITFIYKSHLLTNKLHLLTIKSHLLKNLLHFLNKEIYGDQVCINFNFNTLIMGICNENFRMSYKDNKILSSSTFDDIYIGID